MHLCQRNACVLIHVITSEDQNVDVGLDFWAWVTYPQDKQCDFLVTKVALNWGSGHPVDHYAWLGLLKNTVRERERVLPMLKRNSVTAK